ncbi:hypothetical protein V6N12_024836 [Hibiscus sabdariffa]|uniref:Disease resistance R13L4/SHOC-2-like LRR domain-containing protein n=1 Tax=Hibiscus sabdariffa TaxID=183260 RepID=A0ABR2B9I5_9ROSI
MLTEAGSPPVYYVGHPIYKGNAALIVEPRSPEFVPLDSAKQGFVLLRFAPAAAAGVSQYDWGRMQVFPLSESCEFFHDPFKGKSDEGKVRKVLKVEPLPDGSGDLFNLSLTVLMDFVEGVENKLVNTDESIHIHITRAEFTVLKRQKDKVGEAFAKHQERYKEDKILKWRNALTDVANIKGWHLNNRHESEFIGDIVKKLSAKLCQTYPVVIDGLVGIDSRSEELYSKINIGEDDVTEVVEAMIIDNKRESERLLDLSDALLKMKKLRLLKVLCPSNCANLNYLSNELRLLDWTGYPLRSLPWSFQPDNLVALLLSYSRIQQLWKGSISRPLYKLNVVNLKGCENLIHTPDFTATPNLEFLILKGCSNLRKLPEIDGKMECLLKLYLERTGIEGLPSSIGKLSNLNLLNLKDCRNLVSLPSSIGGCTSLRNLNLSGCKRVENLPEKLQQVEFLEELDLSETGITEPPSFIFQFKNLKVLSFGGFKAPSSKLRKILPSLFKVIPRGRTNPVALMLPSLLGLSSLKELKLRNCNLCEGDIPNDISCLSSLETLDLSGSLNHCLSF